MKTPNVSPRRLTGLCAEVSEDDGLDPHVRSRLSGASNPLHDNSHSGLDRKALQLCHQVAETLEEVLAECGDPLLQTLRVIDVEPAPDASRLLVTVAADDFAPENLDPGQVHDRLSRASGHLRGEVAGAITRKRAPVLVYRIVPVSC